MPRYIVIDGNGLGFGLIDFLVQPSSDDRTGEEFAAFEVINDDKKHYKKIDNKGNTYGKILWIVKADTELNFEGYTALLQQMGSGKLKFLQNERDAKGSLEDTKAYSALSAGQKADAIRPFVLTTALKNEMMNLTRPENASTKFSLVPINKSMGKDKVSSLMYGIYVIKILEDKERNKKRGSLAQMAFFN